MNAPNTNNELTIDPARIAHVVRTVIERLKAQSQYRATQTNDRIVSVETIKQANVQNEKLVVPTASIITPAAIDEAARRGIQIERENNPVQSTIRKQLNPTQAIIDRNDLARREAISAQLARRNVDLADGVQVICTNTPAAEVHEQCTGGQRAVMVRGIGDVDRFRVELDPTVWVLDMTQINLIAAVNTIARIAQTSTS